MPKKKHSATQDHINIAEIRDGIVITRDGSFRMVLLATSINFALKSEQEQNALIGQYQGFLNSLNFPLQIVMQSRKLDLTSYLKSLEERIKKEDNELIKIQIADYVQFIRRLINVANIMDKRFYIVVPLDPPNIKKRGLFDKVLNPTSQLEVKISPTEFKSFSQEIKERVGVIMSGLSSLGVRVAPLNTQQVIELFYSVYNPEESTKERLINANDLEAPMVERKNE
ncbi:MAG: hypothetical protein ACD_58C00316G0005 [uncultured bacterium]|nr:MAG: hypothetical protein ACD_58C00316G0005 [uncultured bacterium]